MRATIATKMYGFVFTGGAALLLVALFAWYCVAHLDGRMEELVRHEERQKTLSMEASISMGDAIHSFKDYLLRKDPKFIDAFKKDVADIDTDLQELDKLVTNDEERQALKDAQTYFPPYRASLDEMVTARNKTDDIAAVDRQIKGVDRPLRFALDKLAALSDKAFTAHRKEAEAHAVFLTYLLLAGVLVVGFIFCAMGVAVTRNMTGRIKSVVAAIGRVAEKDLTVVLAVNGGDELAEMADDFNRMVAATRQMVVDINGSSTQLATAVSQLNATATQIATGAEEVASQAATVAVASEEMAATSADIARNSAMAADGAQHANGSALAGVNVADQTIGGMARIAERVRASAQTVENLGARSDQIGEIVGTIEDIADQTNLLALNAAIEAARAGEQGRGFAVVADEVRALAERTTRATREIGEMIKAIQTETKGAVAAMEEGVREVESGTADAARSGEALKEILTQIESVTMQVSQIATAAEEQTATTTEITGNIQQITDVVQETARGAQESAAAASQLSLMAEELHRMVGQFRIAG